MMAYTLKQFVSNAAKRVSIVFDKTGELLPMYHAIKSDGGEVVFAAPKAATKDESFEAARRVLAQIDAVRVVFCCEAWMLESTPESDIERIAKEGVAAQPNRIEVLMLSAEDDKEGMVMASRQIFRTGDRVVLGALKFFPGKQNEGRLIGMLPVRGTRQ